MASIKLQREQKKILSDIREMYRRHIRAAVDADDIKALTDLIKSALVAKNWQWIYDENINPWQEENNGKSVSVRIYGENDLLP